MARSKTLGTLRSEIRERGEIRNNYVSNAVLTAWINESVAELYDLLVQSNPNLYLSSNTISVTSGTNTYALPSNFYKLVGMDVQDGTDWYNIRPFNFAERNAYGGAGASKRMTRYHQIGVTNVKLNPDPGWSGNIRAWYIAAPPAYDTTSNDANASTNFDYIAGYEEYIILDCLIKKCGKDESDATLYAAQKNAIIKRIKSSVADLDEGEPGRIRDIQEEAAGDLMPTYYNP